MKKRIEAALLAALLCLTLILPAALSETRQGVIYLEGMEEPVEETLFSTSQGFSFWYVADRMEAYETAVDGIDCVYVGALYLDDSMLLTLITEEEAAEYAKDLDENIVQQAKETRVQKDIYYELENGRYYFLTLIGENGRYLWAAGSCSVESVEGNGKFFQLVLDSVTLTAE